MVSNPENSDTEFDSHYTNSDGVPYGLFSSGTDKQEESDPVVSNMVQMIYCEPYIFHGSGDMLSAYIGVVIMLGMALYSRSVICE